MVDLATENRESICKLFGETERETGLSKSS
jgi:hypothetical protein